MIGSWGLRGLWDQYSKSQQFGSTLQQRLRPLASTTITCSAGNTTPTNTAAHTSPPKKSYLFRNQYGLVKLAQQMTTA